MLSEASHERDHNIGEMKRRRALREWKDLEYEASPEELRQREGYRIAFARDQAEYQKAHKAKSGISPSDVAKHLGVSEEAFDELDAEARLSAINSFRRSVE